MKSYVTKQIDGTTYYLCSKCKNWLTKDCFSKDNTSLHGNRGGLCRQCKHCQKEHYVQQRAHLLNDDDAAWRYKLQQALKGTRRRSKIKNTYNDLDLEFIMYLWAKQNGKCAITGLDMTYKFYEGRVNTNVSIDRIDSSKGYTKDNVQLVCMVANQMKNDLTQSQLLDLCRMIITNNDKSSSAMQREELKAKTALKNKVAGER